MSKAWAIYGALLVWGWFCLVPGTFVILGDDTVHEVVRDSVDFTLQVLWVVGLCVVGYGAFYVLRVLAMSAVDTKAPAVEAERLETSGVSELKHTADQLLPSTPAQVQVERRLQAVRPALTLPEMAQIMSARGFHPTSVQFGDGPLIKPKP